MLHSVRGRNNPAGLQRCFLGERGKKEVFIISSSLKSLMLKISIVTSIFRNIFAQDCRIDLACLTFFFLHKFGNIFLNLIYIYLSSHLNCLTVLWFFRIITGGGDRS